MARGDNMNPVPATTKLTYDDFLRFPDDGLRHELIDGEHYVTASPNLRHQRILGRLYVLIATHLQTHPTGEVFIAPFDVVMSDIDVVEPDLLYLSHERRGLLTPANLRGAPDLAVEVLSPSTRRTDEVIKRKLFERREVTEYWIVDPDLDAIKVYRRVDGSYARVAELTAEHNDQLTTPLMPGLAIALTPLFTEPA